MAKCLSFSAKPVHSFQRMAKGLKGLGKDRRMASSRGTDICMQGGMREFSQMTRKWWKSTRLADLMTATVDKRVAERESGVEEWPGKKIWNGETVLLHVTELCHFW